MTPLQITARIVGRISMPHGSIALDGLLAAAVAMRDGLPLAMCPADVVPIEIPVEREPLGRFHLASCSIGSFERFGLRWINRRFPVAEAQELGSTKIRRIDLSTGHAKSFRIPLEAGHLADDRLTWFCIGDADEIRDLLSFIGYLGKKRSVGLGKVASWTVDTTATWSGFPVASPDGAPLRPLPLDWAGLMNPRQGYRNLTYPYPVALNPHEELCAIP